MFLQDQPADEPVPIAAMLDTVTTRLGLARIDSVSSLEEHWSQLLGPEIASVCRLRSLRDARLTIEVTDTAVADHLKWMRRDLINAANSICGGTVVEDVVIKVGRRG